MNCRCARRARGRRARRCAAGRPGRGAPAARGGAKLDGARHLLDALAGASPAAPLDFVWLFSSITALHGGAGQANYAAANAALDGYAHALRARGVPATAINWGRGAIPGCWRAWLGPRRPMHGCMPIRSNPPRRRAGSMRCWPSTARSSARCTGGSMRWRACRACPPCCAAW
ncbi:KR domain-containing protein [Burkholderia gladioli]|uniref:KR domain-containing protein n=1 Tax=Burkholderia gladioli TaxID=28095 RepID=UPI003709418A